MDQGHSQAFLKGDSNSSIGEAEVWRCSSQLLRNFKYFNESKLSKALHFMQKKYIKHISAPGMKLVLDKAT